MSYNLNFKKKDKPLLYMEEKTKTMNMSQLYKEHKSFKIYVDKYCKKHELTVDEALKHQIVIATAEMYEERGEQNESTGSSDMGKSNINCG